MKQSVTVVLLFALLFASETTALAWHDTGHMLVAQIAYLRLSPKAKAEVDRLLITPANRRPLIHLCAGYYQANTCEKTYDPITIAVWMDDFRGDSLNDSYDSWHYINYKPFFDGIPERPNVGPEPLNVVDRINWALNSLRQGTGRDKRDAEALGFFYHLAGDIHQPLHATTRYTAAKPDGDAGGNGFTIKLPPDGRDGSLHFLWDAGAGRFGFDTIKRPLDQAGRDRLRMYAEEIMKSNPAESMPELKDLEPLHWADESNKLAREFAFTKTKEGEAPSKAYIDEAQKIVGRRIALAGYRAAEVLNRVLDRPEKPASR
jgi:hypothetical protein